MKETWELIVRRIVRMHNLEDGYTYDCSYLAGCKDIHEKNIIPVYFPNIMNDICIGTIYGLYEEIDVYGREYMKILGELVKTLKKETGTLYELILKEEKPRIKTPLQKYLFPFLDLWVIGCLGISIFAWIGIMFCYCFALALAKMF